MDRLSLLASGCTAIVVVFALLTPTQFINAFSPEFWLVGVPIASVEPASPAPEKPRLKRTINSEPEPQLIEASFSVPEFSSTPELAEVQVPEPPRPVPVNTVKESVFLYSLNHPESRVLTTLPVGEVVVPQMQIYDGGMDWTYVSVPALRISGYLQSDAIELKIPGLTH